MSERERDDYLWDGAGEPDPEVERLERLLAPLRHDAPLAVDALAERDESGEPDPGGDLGDPDAPADAPPVSEFEGDLAAARARRRRSRARVAVLAVAAAAAAAMWLLARDRAQVANRDAPGDARAAPVREPDTGWRVTALAGAPRRDGADLPPDARLGVGQWLETDRDARVEVEVADIGSLVVEPGSRLRRVVARADTAGEDQHRPEDRPEHRVELARGEIRAQVVAPPRLFVVDTPAATAVDLGCAYTLAVDDDGRGLLTVTSGHVSLERGARAAFVPAGARCEIRPGVGPGTPHADDAPAALRAALAAFDFAGGGRPALEQVIALARPRDTITLWNLLATLDRATPADRALVALVHDRLAALVPPPERATREQLLEGDPDALLWWRLDLEDRWLDATDEPSGGPGWPLDGTLPDDDDDSDDSDDADDAAGTEWRD